MPCKTLIVRSEMVWFFKVDSSMAHLEPELTQSCCASLQMVTASVSNAAPPDVMDVPSLEPLNGGYK